MAPMAAHHFGRIKSGRHLPTILLVALIPLLLFAGAAQADGPTTPLLDNFNRPTKTRSAPRTAPGLARTPSGSRGDSTIPPSRPERPADV